MNAFAASAMLHPGIEESYLKNTAHALAQKGVQCLTSKKPSANNNCAVLTTVDAATFLSNPDLAEEVFGPYSILIQCENVEELKKVWKNLKGQISTTIMGTDKDIDAATDLLNMSLSIAGRIVINGVPTGVEVCDSMVHGGPYPASTDSRFTAVGVQAAKRWLRPISFQNWPVHLLPAALQNHNPLGIWRNINGALSKNEINA